MFSFNKTDNLQNQAQLAQLAPSQLTARRRLKEKLESLEKQLPSKRVTEDEVFEAREFDSMFKPLSITKASQDTGMDEINTLKKKISSLESSINLTRSEMLQLSAKLQKLISEYDDVNSKLARILLKDIPEEMPMKSKKVDLVNIMGIGDKVVIPLKIKLPNVKEYTLDAQIDSGAMCSCCKFGAIPSYYWQPTKLSLRAVNKELMQINYISPDFPVYLNHVQTYVTLYSFDTRSNILLGQDFLKRFLPVTFGKDFVTFTTNEGPVIIPLPSI